MDGLYDRVKALERILTHVLKSAKVTGESSLGAISQAPVRSTEPDEEPNDAGQFSMQASANDDLSLSSQVAAMKDLLSRPPSPRPGVPKESSTVEVLVELPDPASLKYLLDVYFRDLDNYFPFLDRQDTESCIYSVIHRLGYSSNSHILVVPSKDLPVIALACIMLALAECLDSGEGACDADAQPGWDRYLASCRAIHQFSLCKAHNMDVVRAQCLVAAYLMHCEALMAASEAIFATRRLGTSIGLNNQRAWGNEDERKTLQKQKLWWTIYFLDRQISRRSGTAYHIRDTEFDVDEFRLDEKMPDAQIHCVTSITRSYLQALISSARLWGQVWDTFFAVGAKKKGDWMEVDIMDARILNTRRLLPKTLTWNSNELARYSQSDENEPHIRRRLQLFTVSVLGSIC